MSDLRPSVSVIIAAKNAAPWLDEQLDALARQTYQGPFEVLVCDNGSTDGTRQVVQRRLQHCPWLRLIDASSHPGQSYARNVGVEQAAGEVIAFCDADDVVSDVWLEVMAVSAATRDVVVAGRMSTDALNPPWAKMVHHVSEQPSSTLALPYAGAGNLAMRKEIFQAVGGFNAEHVAGCEDVDLCWRLQEAGYALTFESNAVVQIRLRRSVRGIYRQGYLYGSGFAEIEGRFGLAGGGPNTAGSPERDRGRKPQQILTLMLTHPGRGSLGAALWHAGWHFGHRSSAVTADRVRHPLNHHVTHQQ